jgi:hypothetical protein
MQTFVHSFRDLQVYQLAFEGSVDLYRLIHQFPEGFDVHLAGKIGLYHRFGQGVVQAISKR